MRKVVKIKTKFLSHSDKKIRSFKNQIRDFILNKTMTKNSKKITAEKKTIDHNY